MMSLIELIKIKMNKLISLLMSLTLVACATPVSKLGEDDYVWTEASVSINYQQAYRNLKKGLDLCQIPSVAVESNLYTDINEGTLVLYLKSWLGGSNGFVFGTVKLKMKDEATWVRIGVQTQYSNPLFGKLKPGERMLKYVSGTYDCD